MAKAAGWFPDPGGAAGTYRWWDGNSWTSAITTDPHASPPPFGGLQRGGQTGYQGGFQGGRSGFQPGPAPLAPGALPYDLPPERRGADKGLIGIAVALVLLLALVAFIAVRALGGGSSPFNPKPTVLAGGDETQNVCPKPKKPTQYPHPVDGRVHGGAISYPMLPSPWSAPVPDDRLAFGVDVVEQMVVTEPGYAPAKQWVSALLVAELNAGDGFYEPKEGAEIVAKCVMGTYYGDAKLDRTEIASEAMTVDGHDAWRLEFHLGFDIKGLKAKGETVVIIVVDTGKIAKALYYASVPDNHPEHLAQAKSVIPQLRISE